MNIITREIMTRFNLSAEEALEVQFILDDEHSIDYSEASQQEHNNAYDAAYADWKTTKVNS